MADIEAVFGLIRERITPELGQAGGQGLRHWVLVQDDAGAELSQLDAEHMPPHELLASLIADGAEAAAYITHRASDPACVVAQVLVASPPNSDTRRADVLRRDDGSVLDRWQGPIS